MVGVCVVLLYRMTGVLNIAQAAVGAFGTMVLLELREAGAGLGIALLAGVLAAATLAGLLGALVARFYSDSSAEVRTVLSAAVLVGLMAVGFRLFGNDPRTLPSLLPGTGLTVAGVVISSNALVLLVLAVGLALAVGRLLTSTRLGILLRAVSSRPVTAEMLGVRVGWLSVGVWAMVGAITAIAVTGIAPTRPSNFLSLSLLVMPAMAAALLGGLRSLAGTVAGGLLIGVLEGAATAIPQVSQYRQVLPFVVILGCLLWSQRGEVWDAAR